MDINLMLSIITYSLLFTFLFSFIIIFFSPLLRKYCDSIFEVIFPVYNLFKLCQIVGINEFITFLYLIPGLNIFLMIFILIKLIKVKNEDKEEKKKSRKEKSNDETEEEIDDFEKFEDDSIFKVQKKTKIDSSNNKPYKARKVMVNEDFINSAPAEQERIKRVNKNDE